MSLYLLDTDHLTLLQHDHPAVSGGTLGLNSLTAPMDGDRPGVRPS